tara:strand:- start:135 stop:902 length:768 start_codon:yes stop_codon:yes gene_type:complete
MKICKLILFLLTFIHFSGCSTKKDINYISDFNRTSDFNYEYQEYKIKVDDILKIDVNSKNPEASIEFNPRALNTSMSTNKTSLLYNGYIVNSQGEIIFPVFGRIYVKNKTVDEIRQMIYNLIKNGGYLKEPSVDVKLLNTSFTILGEVASPGRYEYTENNMNIFKAIGMAGDLTITGERKNIKIIRDLDGEREVKEIDLTSSDVFKNKYFQIQSGDIIIVNPNNARVKNAGIIGNAGTLLSLLSFLLSSIIVINR